MAHEGKGWLRKLLSGEPHQIIGSVDNPYLKRWHIWPNNRFANAYLHQFLRSDDDRALHDHPWPFLSIILKGGYWEHRAGKPITAKSWRTAGSIAFRRPTVAHRVELETEHSWRGYGEFGALRVEREKSVWTLILTGPHMRQWGFHCPRGWMYWKTFDHQNGCGET